MESGGQGEKSDVGVTRLLCSSDYFDHQHRHLRLACRPQVDHCALRVLVSSSFRDVSRHGGISETLGTLFRTYSHETG